MGLARRGIVARDNAHIELSADVLHGTEANQPRFYQEAGFFMYRPSPNSENNAQDLSSSRLESLAGTVTPRPPTPQFTP